MGDSVYYLRSVSGAWQLVRLTGSELTVLHMFAAGAAVSGLGYYDGRQVINMDDKESAN